MASLFILMTFLAIIGQVKTQENDEVGLESEMAKIVGAAQYANLDSLKGADKEVDQPQMDQPSKQSEKEPLADQFEMDKPSKQSGQDNKPSDQLEKSNPSKKPGMDKPSKKPGMDKPSKKPGMDKPSKKAGMDKTDESENKAMKPDKDTQFFPNDDISIDVLPFEQDNGNNMAADIEIENETETNSDDKKDESSFASLNRIPQKTHLKIGPNRNQRLNPPKIHKTKNLIAVKKNKPNTNLPKDGKIVRVKLPDSLLMKKNPQLSNDNNNNNNHVQANKGKNSINKNQLSQHKNSKQRANQPGVKKNNSGADKARLGKFKPKKPEQNKNSRKNQKGKQPMPKGKSGQAPQNLKNKNQKDATKIKSQWKVIKG